MFGVGVGGSYSIGETSDNSKLALCLFGAAPALGGFGLPIRHICTKESNTKLPNDNSYSNSYNNIIIIIIIININIVYYCY